MIGQKNLQNRIEQLIENGTFPRFSILVGPKGSGKKTLSEEIVERFIFKAMETNSYAFGFTVPDVRIDTIRSVIEQAYKVTMTSIYIISDADTMSNAAKNALLKVTEEPPNNAYFIMTLEDGNNTLETIRSRGTVFHMDRYTPDEIGSYFYDKYHANHGEDEEEIVRELCDTPGDVDTLVKMGIKEFYDYVQLVVDNIAEVSLANAFKIPSKVALKEDVDGYDLRLFWKAFMKIVITNRTSIGKNFLETIKITSKYLQKLRVKGINKQMLMDNWVLEIRELWQSL